jgi:hypothetical protein
MNAAGCSSSNPLSDTHIPMATTGENFVEVVSAGNGLLSGSAVTATPFVLGLSPVAALDTINATPDNTAIAPFDAVPLDKVVFDLSLTTTTPGVGTTFPCFGKFVGAFAKNGAALINLTGTTAVTLNMQDWNAFTGVTAQAGDTSLATVNCLIFNNLGTTNLTVSLASSDPAGFPTLGGTTPTFQVPAGGAVCWYNPAGIAVTPTTSQLTITPTAGGSLAVAYGGA